jgi:hypothetical protein
MKPRAAYNYFSISGAPGAWDLKGERFSLNQQGDDVSPEPINIFGT